MAAGARFWFGKALDTQKLRLAHAPGWGEGMTRVLLAKEGRGAGQVCIRLLTEILGEMTLEKYKATPAGCRQGGPREL